MSLKRKIYTKSHLNSVHTERAFEKTPDLTRPVLRMPFLGSYRRDHF